MTYETWQEALAGLVKEEGLEETELGDISKRASAHLESRERWNSTSHDSVVVILIH